MRRKLRGLITFLLAYVTVIFFSYDIPRWFPNRSEAREHKILQEFLADQPL